MAPRKARTLAGGAATLEAVFSRSPMHRTVWRLGALVVFLPALAAQAQAPQADGPPVRLVADGAAALAPQWSPDGARLAFTRTSYRGLWTVAADGSGAREVTDAAAAGFGFEWAPDGAALLARPARYEGRDRLHAVVVYGLDGAARELTDWQSQAMPIPHWAGPASVVLAGRGGVDVLALDDGARASRRAGRWPSATAARSSSSTRRPRPSVGSTSRARRASST